MIDILRRAGVQPADAERIEQDVRRDWGGERPYIAKVGEARRKYVETRNARIRLDAHRGESSKLLSRRYGMSLRRINQILCTR